METKDELVEDTNPGPSKPVIKVVGVRRKRGRWIDTSNCRELTPLHRLHQMNRKANKFPEMESEDEDGESEDVDVGVDDVPIAQTKSPDADMSIDQKWRPVKDNLQESGLLACVEFSRRKGFLILDGRVWRPTNEDPNLVMNGQQLKHDSDVPIIPQQMLITSLMNFVNLKPEVTLQHIPLVQKDQLASDSGQQNGKIIEIQSPKPRQEKNLDQTKKKQTLKSNQPRKPTKRKRSSAFPSSVTLDEEDINMDILNIGDDWTAAAEEIKNIGRVNDSEKWTIEELVDVRFRPDGREFLVKWEGWARDYNSWEPEENFDSTEFVQSFLEERRKNKKNVIQNFLNFVS